MKNNRFLVLALLKFILSFAYLCIQIDVGRFFDFWSITLEGLGFYDLNLIQHFFLFFVFGVQPIQGLNCVTSLLIESKLEL
jgi:hypothetical protein